MRKFLAASILGLAALAQSAAAAPSQQVHSAHQPATHKVIVHKIGVTRPLFHAPVYHAPIVVKPIVLKPVTYKPYGHNAVIYRPLHTKHIVTLQPSYYPTGYKPMYRYYPLATYGYDSAPKACILMIYKSSYGLVNKVWRCSLVDNVEVAPVKVIAATPTVIERTEPAPTKIIERIIERHTIEKQIPVVPADDVLPPK